MGPRAWSRYIGYRARIITDPKRGDIRYLDLPDPVGYRDLPGTRVIPVRGGETWYQLAARAFPDYPRGGTVLVWLLMDFQPTPAVDPVELIEASRVVYAPAEDAVPDLMRSRQTVSIAGI